MLCFHGYREQKGHWTGEVFQVISSLLTQEKEPSNHGSPCAYSTTMSTPVLYYSHLNSMDKGEALHHNYIIPLSLQAFQNYESLTMEGCIFQFFSLLSKFHSIDVESFQNCAVGVSIYLIPISPHAREESVLVSGMSLERSCTTYYYWPH